MSTEDLREMSLRAFCGSSETVLKIPSASHIQTILSDLQIIYIVIPQLLARQQMTPPPGSYL